MYKKSTASSNRSILSFGIFFIVFLLIGVAGFIYTQNSDNKESEEKPDSVEVAPAPEGGVIATFGGGNRRQSNQSETETPETKAAVDFSDLPYELPLPAGWAETDSLAEEDPCGSGDTVTTNTYKNGQETLIVYENGSARGCDNSTIADVYFDYDFSDDDSGIELDTTVINKCSKAEIPSCPEGDGKVSIFIGNEDPQDPNKFVKNEITNKSYFFSLTDTKIDSDFESQVRNLVKLIKSIAIN